MIFLRKSSIPKALDHSNWMQDVNPFGYNSVGSINKHQSANNIGGSVFCDEENYYMDVVNRHIDAVAGSIFGIFFSADTIEKISFHDILNRVMLLVQAPILFILCKKEHGVIKEKYHFSRDTLHEPEISECIDKAIHGENHDDSKYLFNLFDSDYYMIVIYSYGQNTRPTEDAGQEYQFIPLPNDASTLPSHTLLIKKLQRIFDGKLYSSRFGDVVLSQLNQVLEKYDYIKDNDTNSKCKKGCTSYFDDYKLWHNKFIRSLERDATLLRIPRDDIIGSGVIDKVYIKSRFGLLLGAADEIPELPNFLLFMRNYSGTVRRRGEKFSHNYEIRIIVCSQQEKDFRRYFESLSRMPDKQGMYIESFEENNSYIELAKQANDKFWSLIENRKENGISGHDILLNIIRKPFIDESYSVSDPVFRTGIINFRNPSINGGLHRAYKIDNNFRGFDRLDKSIQDSILRIVAVHYIFRGMTTRKNKDMRIMLCPVELHSRILAVVGYVTTSADAHYSDSDDISDLDIKTFSENWRNSYHTFIDLYVRLKRNMRSFLWQLYIQMVSQVCAYSINECADADELEDVESVINQRLILLSCFFSYPNVVITFTTTDTCSFSSEKDPCEIVMLTEGVDQHNNPVSLNMEVKYGRSSFPILPGRKDGTHTGFISLKEVASRIETNLLYLRVLYAMDFKNGGKGKEHSTTTNNNRKLN